MAFDRDVGHILKMILFVGKNLHRSSRTHTCLKLCGLGMQRLAGACVLCLTLLQAGREAGIGVPQFGVAADTWFLAFRYSSSVVMSISESCVLPPAV
jgi:hypothetical protein